MSRRRNPKPLLAPAMHGVLERMVRAGHPPLHSLMPAQARAAYAAGADVLEGEQYADRLRMAGVPVPPENLQGYGARVHQDGPCDT